MAATNFISGLVTIIALYGCVLSDPQPCTDAIGKCAKESNCTKDNDIQACLETAKTANCIGEGEAKMINNAIESAKLVCALTDLYDSQKPCLGLFVECTASLTSLPGECTIVRKLCETQAAGPFAECKKDNQTSIFNKLSSDCRCIETQTCAGPNNENITCNGTVPSNGDKLCYEDKDHCEEDKSMALYSLTTLCGKGLESAYNEDRVATKCDWQTVIEGMKLVKGADECKDRKKVDDAWKAPTCPTLKSNLLDKTFKTEEACKSGAAHILAPTAMILIMWASLVNNL